MSARPVASCITETEDGLDWNNAPKNITADATLPQFASEGVQLLIGGYSFDLGLASAEPPRPTPKGLDTNST